MPQADLKYSADMAFDAVALLAAIEAEISEFDGGAGDCKSRAYPTTEFKHTHILLTVRVLKKPHRDAKFMRTLLERLTDVVDQAIQQPCSRSVELDFLPDFYMTGKVSG